MLNWSYDYAASYVVVAHRKMVLQIEKMMLCLSMPFLKLEAINFLAKTDSIFTIAAFFPTLNVSWVIIGGLMSSLILTVFLVPMMYYLVDTAKEKIERNKK